MKPTCHRAGVPDHGHGRTGAALPLHRGGAVLLLLAALALAGSPARADTPPIEPAPALTDADPAFDAAWAQLVAGDLSGARDAAAALAMTHPDRAPEAGYLIAITLWELGQTGEALVALDGVASRWPDTSWAHDARFRRAAYLAGLGRVEDARSELDRLAPWRRFSPADQAKLTLCDRTWRLRQSGSTGDLHALERLLASASPGETLFHAYGWLAIVDHHARRASTAVFVGSDAAQRREVQAVGAALTAAESALETLVTLPEPGVRVEGALAYARALAAVGDALVVGAVPGRLSPEQQDRYTTLIRARAVTLWGKALSVVELSRTGPRAEGPVAEALRRELDTLATELTSRLR